MRNKLIFGALLGATICGSAFADASVANRKAFCEQADGFVWVEKTQACIPEDPCESENEAIKKAYCVSAPFAAGPEQFEKYIEIALNKNTKWGRIVPSGRNAYYTMDGDYMVFNAVPVDDIIDGEVAEAIKAACWVNGYAVNRSIYDWLANKGCTPRTNSIMGCTISPIKPSNSKAGNCDDLAKYASEITGLQLVGYYKAESELGENVCVIAPAEGVVCDHSLGVNW